MHGAEESRGIRNRHRAGQLTTAQCQIALSAPQVAGRDAPFRSEIGEKANLRSDVLDDMAVEMLAAGLRRLDEDLEVGAQ